MRTLLLSLSLVAPLLGIAAAPAAADVPTRRALPTAACNEGTMNAHERVPETTGNGSAIHAHEAIPGMANIRPCGHGG